MPCTELVYQELPLVCFNNGQRGVSELREVERLEGKIMYDLVVGSKQLRLGWGCYRKVKARVRQTRLRMHHFIRSRRMSARGEGFTCQIVELSSLPVNESGGCRCNAWFSLLPGTNAVCNSQLSWDSCPFQRRIALQNIFNWGFQVLRLYASSYVQTCFLICGNSKLAFSFSPSGTVTEQGRRECINRHGYGRNPPR